MPGFQRAEMLRLQRSTGAMGSTFSIVLYGHDQDLMEAAVGAALDEARRLDNMLSGYRPESEWSLINREAARRPVAISAELFQLLSVCVEHSRQTEGAFDLTVGPLKRAWGFFRGTGRVPTAAELVVARSHVGYRFVQLDAGTQTVQFDHPGVEIDPGGIGKGYAVDRMAGILRAQGFDAALVAGSASSLYGLGSPPDRSHGWPARIQDPEHPGTCISETALKDLSLSTSGTGEKSFWSDAKMYSHIIDPRTGQPLQVTAQVSVVAPSALDGEVWAKACLLNGPRWAREKTPGQFRVLFHSADPAQRPEWF